MGKITPELKQKAIKVYEETGLLTKVAEAIGVHVSTLRDEMKRSAVFRKKMVAAKEIGALVVGDKALQGIQDYADGKLSSGKSDRNQLTALIALANAYIPGFRGRTAVDHKVDGEIKITHRLPRPNYKEVKEEPKKRIPEPMKDNLIALTGQGERVYADTKVGEQL